MASRFWVGGAGTWDGTATTHWAATSGGAGGASVPTGADDVFLDANSGGGVITAGATMFSRNFDSTGFTGTLSLGPQTLITSGPVFTIGTGTTWTAGAIWFQNTASATTVTTNGKTGTTAIDIKATGQVVTLADALTCGTLTQTSGTFTTSGFAITTTGFSSNNANTRVLNLGSSSITITGTGGGNGYGWSVTTTNFTINAGTSTITFTGSGGLTGGGSYNNVIYSGFTSGIGLAGGGPTFVNLSILSGASKTAQVFLNGAVTVSGNLTVIGNSQTNRVLVASGATGTARAITVNGSVNASNVDFLDIAAGGTANWDLSLIPGGSGDAGGNSGIIFSASNPQSWNTTSGGNWSDVTKWNSAQTVNQLANPSFETDTSGWLSNDVRAAVGRLLPYAYDDFSAADGTALLNRLTPIGGKSWQIIAGGGWSISGGQATGASNGNGNWVDIGVTDSDVTVLVGAMPSGGNEVGVVARATDSSNFYTAVFAGDGRVHIWKNVAGTFTSLTALTTPANGPVAIGRRFGLRCQGSRLAVLVDGVEAASVVDTSLTTGTKFGFRVGSPDSGVFDNFSATVPYGPPLGKIGSAVLSAPSGAYNRFAATASTQYTFSAYVNPSITGPVGIYGVQAPTPTTETGPARRYQMVKNGPGPIVEEGTTNLVPYSGFEQGVTGWSVTGASTWFSVDPSSAFQGSQSMKVTSQGAGFCGFQTSKAISIVGGQTYTISVYAKKTGSNNPSFYCWTYDAANVGTSFGGTTPISTTSTWARYTLTATAPSSAIQMVVGFVYPNNSTVGDAFWIDCVQVEQKSYATSYVDGGLGNGYTYDTTTNLLSNPSLDVNATGWASGDSSSPLVRTTSQANRTGGAAAQVTGTSAFFRQATTANTAYTLSGYLRLPVAGNAGVYLTGSPTPSTEQGPSRRYQMVSKGPGPLVEEATVNMVLNPSFETDTSGWNGAGSSGPGFSRDTSRAYAGNASLKVVPSGAGNQALMEQQFTTQAMTSVSATQIWTASAYILPTTVANRQARVYINWYDANRGFLSTAAALFTTTLVAGKWQRVVTSATAPANAAWAMIGLAYSSQDSTNLAVGDIVWWDGVQIEQKAYATTYSDGSLGTGYSWDATTNLVTNPSFDIWTTATAAPDLWTVQPAATVNRVVGRTGVGYAAQFSSTSATNNGTGRIIAPTSMVPAGISTISFYARRTAGTGDVAVGSDSVGFPLTSTAFGAGANPTAWNRYSITVNNATGSAKNLFFNLANGTDTTSVFEIDDVQVEARSYLTPYTANQNILSANDSSFETTLGSWGGANSGTVALSSNQALVGTKSQQVTLPTNATAGQTGTGLLVSGLTAGTTYTASAWVFIPVGSVANVTMSVQGWGGGSLSADIGSVQGTWRRVSVTVTPTGTSFTIYILNGAASTAGQVFYIDAVQLEVGGLSNFAKAGTPGTTSTRLDGTITFTTTSVTGASTLIGSMRLSSPAIGTSHPYTRAVSFSDNTDGNYLAITHWNNGQLVLETSGQGGWNPTGNAAAAGSIVNYAITLDTSGNITYYTSIAGGAVQTITFTGGTALAAKTKITFGPVNDIHENVMTFSSALDATTCTNFVNGTSVPSTLANRADCAFSAFVNDASTNQAVAATAWTRLLQQKSTVKGQTQSDVVVILPGSADVYSPEYFDDFQLESRPYATPYTTNQNLLPVNDSSFETSAGAWVNGGVGAMTRDTTTSLAGTSSLKKVTLSNFDGASISTFGTPPSGQAFTISAWVMTNTTGAQVQIANGGGANTGPLTLTAGVWTRLFYTNTSTGSGAADGVLQIRQTNAGTVPATIWIDAVQVEYGGLSNYANAGTPGTTSTRARNILEHNVSSLTLSGSAVTVLCWGKVNASTSAGIPFVRLGFSGNAGDDEIWLMKSNDNNKLGVGSLNAGGTGAAALGVPAVGDIGAIAAVISGTSRTAYVSQNGGAVQSFAAGGNGVAVNGTANFLDIGFSNPGARFSNSPVENVMIFNTALDATTVGNILSGVTAPSTAAARADCVFSAFINDGPAASTNLTAGNWTRISQTKTTTPRETQTDIVVIPSQPQGQDSPVFVDAVQVQTGALTPYLDSTGRVPLPQDDVAVNKAFVASQTLTMDMPRMGRSIDFTGTTGGPTWGFVSANTINGSLTLPAGGVNGVVRSLTFIGRGAYTLRMNGNTLGFTNTLWAPGGSLTQLDDANNTGALLIQNGTFSTGGFASTWGSGITLVQGTFDSSLGGAVSATTFSANAGSATRSVLMGSSSWSITGSSGQVWGTSAAGLTLSVGNSVVTFTGAGSATIATGGVAMPSVAFSGAGGTDTFTDNFTTAGTITLTGGTLDTSGQNVTCSVFTLSGTATKSLLLGASTWTCTAFGTNAWNASASTGSTIAAGTSTIILTNSSTFIGGGFTYNSVQLQGSNMTLSLPSTYATLSHVAPGSGGKTSSLTIDSNQTVTSILTLTGNSITNRLLVQSNTLGTRRTLTAANVVASNIDIQDMAGAGASNWNLSAIAGGSGDALGNTGITFTPTATQFRVGTGGNWSDATKWASTSGGAGSSGRVPLPQDPVILDANAAGNVTVDMPRIGKDMSLVGFTGTWTINQNVAMYGSWTCGNSATLNFSAFGLTLGGRGVQTFTGAGKTYVITILAPGGSYTMQDAFLTGSGALFNISLGTWNTNDLPMSVGWLAVQAGATLNAGVSTISLLTTTLPTLTSFSSSANVNGANATWVIAGASAIDRTFGTATGRSYGAVVYTVPNSTGKLIMTGSNTIGTLSVSGGARTVSFTAGSTTTITNWNVNGSAGNPITINSTTPGTQATIKPAVTALVPFQSDFLSLKDILAQNSSGGSGLRNWYAGNFSVDSGNNTGWIFGPVPGVWGFIPI